MLLKVTPLNFLKKNCCRCLKLCRSDALSLLKGQLYFASWLELELPFRQAPAIVSPQAIQLRNSYEVKNCSKCEDWQS